MTGKRLMITLLTVSIVYPSICANSAVAIPAIKPQKTVSSLSKIKAITGRNKGKIKPATPRPNKLKDKRTAMMYYLWYALKHNRSG